MTAEENDVYRYDAFISYNDRDRKWVRGWLLPRLEKAGLRVCIDFRDFELGVASLVNMENAVERSRKTVIVLTPAWVGSEWTVFESLLIQSDDPAGRRARMIPLRLKPCELPKRIAMLTHIDFTQPSKFESQLQRLVVSVRGKQLLPVKIVKLPGQRVRGWLINILGAPAWQGIGGIVAVLALMVALATWLLPGIRASLFPAGPTATPTPTRTPAPTTTPPTTLKPMPGGAVVIEMDGLVIDASDDRCQEVVCRSSPRIETKVLDLTGVRLEPDDFSYNWRFDPPDLHNLDRLDSKSYAIIYSIPCDRDSQMVTIEVLRNGKTLGVRGICFNIERPP